MRRLTLLAVLAGCAASPQAHTPQPTLAQSIPTPPVPPVAAAPSTTGAGAAATAEYKAVERKEVPAINQAIRDGTATPDSIERIHRADVAARAAVRKIVAQDGHPSEAAKQELRRAMEELLLATEAK